MSQIEPRYAFNYAVLDASTKMCIEVRTTTTDYTGVENFVAIPRYSSEYIFKYYINGSWWMDAQATTPFVPSWESTEA